MPYMAWNACFETKIPLMDEQHKALVELVNEVAPLLSGAGDAATGLDPTLLDDLVDRLLAYAGRHFRDEEALMVTGGLHPESIEHHASRHRGFVREVQAMRRAHAAGESLDGPQLLRFLSSWLTFHILGEDKAMAQQLELIADGVSPDEAYRRKRAIGGEGGGDAAQTALQSALLDLFRLNTERNAALAESNARLREARDSLRDMNEHLEELVAARTAELAMANAALERERSSLARALDELKRTESALIESEKHRAIGSLAAGLAHEMNTPLQIVSDALGFLDEGSVALDELTRAARGRLSPEDRGQLDAMADKLEAPFFEAEIPRAIVRARGATARVARMVSALMGFARPRAGGLSPRDLGALVRECLDVAQGHIRQVATIETALSELPLVPCDDSALKRAIVHVLLNAAEAIRDKIGDSGAMGRIAVGTRREDEHVVLWVSDDGVGIAPEIAPRVFEPFFTTREVGRGAGQGLTFARSIIVEQHKGELFFESTPGLGSTFFVRLPIGEGPQAGP